MNTKSMMTEVVLLFAVSLVSTTTYAEVNVRGNTSVQARLFPEDSIHQAQQSSNLSFSLDMEIKKTLGEGDQDITVASFIRIDDHDSERTHRDLREFLYTRSADDWVFRIGLGQVFWGVAESINPVDIINQFDAVEGFGTEAKLGQPMIHTDFYTSWGTFGFYLLPGFRERTFPSVSGRPRLPLPINSDEALYESDDKDLHIDYAARYSNNFDVWSVGFSYFKGTAREPFFVVDPTNQSLLPFYYQMEQLGLETQTTLSNWLLKLESVYRTGEAFTDYSKSVTGVEYSFYSIGSSTVDVGLIGEYLWHDGDNLTDTFENDFFLGTRIALNDTQSSELLAGVIADLDDEGYFYSLEASRRIGTSITGSINARVWVTGSEEGSSDLLDFEDYLEAELSFFF